MSPLAAAPARCCRELWAGEGGGVGITSLGCRAQGRELGFHPPTPTRHHLRAPPPPTRGDINSQAFLVLQVLASLLQEPNQGPKKSRRCRNLKQKHTTAGGGEHRHSRGREGSCFTRYTTHLVRALTGSLPPPPPSCP